MEEKERYIIGIGKGEDIFIADNDRKAMFTITTKKLQDLLNQQDKHIKKLQEEIKKTNINNYLDCFSIFNSKKFNTNINNYQADYWLVEKENQQLKQSQKQLAISELEKVKRTFIDVAWEDVDFAIEIIDDQIKELKGENND